MLNINGLVKVTKLEDLEGSKSSKGTIYFGTKKGSGENAEWENSFFNAVFVGKAFDKVVTVAEKDSIFVTQGLVKNVSYEDKKGNKRSYLSLTVFDFIHGEDEIKAHIDSLNPNKKEQPKKQERQQRSRR
jgi:single-stranded DNA-binding protein